jgi:hypothetical protein
MITTYVFGGVNVTGMADGAGTLRVAAATAHPAHPHAAGAAAAIAAQRKRRAATTTDASVDRSST